MSDQTERLCEDGDAGVSILDRKMTRRDALRFLGYGAAVVGTAAVAGELYGCRTSDNKGSSSDSGEMYRLHEVGKDHWVATLPGGKEKHVYKGQPLMPTGMKGSEYQEFIKINQDLLNENRIAYW